MQMDISSLQVDAPVSDLPFAIVDLHRRAVRLRARPEWRRGTVASSPLVDEAGIHVQLTSLRRGVAFEPVLPDGALILTVVEGAVIVDGAVETVRIEPGQLAYISAGTRWRARAAFDSALILSFQWPAAEEPHDVENADDQRTTGR
jgi:mannose-6-phosphate isomerase-like protein (cupin superfamily)